MANTVTVPVDMMVEPSDVNALVKTLVEATEPLDVPLLPAVLFDPGFEAGLVSPVEHEVENNVAIAEVEVVVRVTGTGTWIVVKPPPTDVPTHDVRPPASAVTLQTHRAC